VPTTLTFDITNLVGIEPEAKPLADEVRDIVSRTVQPATWFDMGGLATLRTYFNPVRRTWHLAAYTGVPRADIETLLNGLGNA
jgi:hypothetical protein